MKVFWKGQVQPTLKPYFEQLAENQSFRLTTGKGAVYTKVRLNGTNKYYMLELATGILFEASLSPVELVDVNVVIETQKPSIY